jgi:hypothetical protein
MLPGPHGLGINSAVFRYIKASSYEDFFSCGLKAPRGLHLVPKQFWKLRERFNNRNDQIRDAANQRVNPTITILELPLMDRENLPNRIPGPGQSSIEGSQAVMAGGSRIVGRPPFSKVLALSVQRFCRLEF